jgi:hypothetical protein
MSVVRTLALAWVAAQLAGCFVFSMPPSVPKVKQPTLAPDVFLEANARSVNQRSSRRETSTYCSSGSCTDISTRVPTTIQVRVASPTVNGNPISIGEVAAAASPEYVSDTQSAREMTSKCKRGRIIMTAGGLGLTAAYFLLQMGYRSDEPNKGAAIGGWAALGGGLAGIAGGHFVFGGQYCNDAKEIYRKWSPIYEDPGATKVESDRAELVEVLVDKFNQDRARVAKPDAEPADPTDEPTED